VAHRARISVATDSPLQTLQPRRVDALGPSFIPVPTQPEFIVLVLSEAVLVLVLDGCLNLSDAIV
jgi:hypothetical protein